MPRFHFVRTVLDDSRARTTAAVQVRPGLKVEASSAHDDLGQPPALGLRIIAHNWSAGLLPNKDAVLEAKRKVKGGQVTVVQRVPAGKAYLVPNPILKYDARAVLRSADRGDRAAMVTSRTQATHDCLLRRTAAFQTFYSGPNRERKFQVGMDSHAGPSAAVRIKLRGTTMHSVAAALSPTLSPMLRLKSRPAPGQKYSLAVELQKAVATMQLKPISGSTKLHGLLVLPHSDEGSRKFVLDLTWEV